jgi:hypothetical protein
METTPGAVAAVPFTAARFSPASRLFVISGFILALSVQAIQAQTATPLECDSVWTSFNWNGSAWRETVVAKTVVEKYSPDGLLVSSELSLLVGGLYEKTDYLYSGGRLLKATARDGSGALLRTTSYAYSESPGQLARRDLTLAADGSRVNEEIHYFGPSGLLDGVAVLAADGSVIAVRSFKYDSRRRLTDEYVATADDTLAWARGCEYGQDDASGNWLEMTDRESYQGAWPHPRYSVKRQLRYAAEASK